MTTTSSLELDALVVGAGFGGVYQLKKLRDKGYTAKLIELGEDFGGVWYWNRYPGARVDSPVPHYEYSDPDLWSDWNWNQRFPGSAELRSYFSYVADKWDLRKDCIFSTAVQSASWDDTQSEWKISLSDGTTVVARFFLPNTGFAAKRYIPDWPGIESFKGTLLHPSYWPRGGLDVKGKNVAVIGTGSTGVQIFQELALDANSIVLFQRTPNLALPMKQYNWTDESRPPKDKYSGLFAGRYNSYGGFDYNFEGTGTFDVTPEQRNAFYEEMWAHGDFHFWLATYHDMLFEDKANTEAYNFWREKVRARIDKPRLKDKLAPMVKPHPYGCKRVSLENGYYELFNLPHTYIVDVNETPIVGFAPQGIKTTEQEYDFDTIICATGFDAITGGILALNLTGKNGIALENVWKGGIKTYMGISIPDFPNMFFTYGPQAPTALCNGPSCAELQGDWIVDTLDYMRKNKLSVINASAERSEQWAELCSVIANGSLLPKAQSWYMGDNIPGKHREPLIFLGGVPTYYKTLYNSANADYDGFEVN